MIIAALGFALGRWRRLDPQPIGRVAFYLLGPCFMFTLLADATVDLRELAGLSLTMVGFALTMTMIGYFIVRWRGSDPIHGAGVLLGAICPNNGNFGLPLISFAFGPEVAARAAVILITTAFWNNSVGVFIASSGKRSPRQALVQVMHVPTLYAAAIGLLFNIFDITLPTTLGRPVELLAGAAVPSMLILLGLQLAQINHMTDLNLIGLGVGLRLILSPLIALGMVLLLGLQAPGSIAFVMQASMPVAVITILYSTEFGLDDQFASSMVMVSTLASPITLSLLIFFLQRSTG